MIEPVLYNFLWNVGVAWLKIPIFIFCCVGRPGLFKCHSTGSIAVCMMENHHTGQEETLMEVTMGMNGVALSHLPRARRRRSSFNKCLLALAALLVIGLVAAVMVYFFFFAPQCNPVRNSAVFYQPLVCLCVCVLIIMLSAYRMSPNLRTQQKSTKSVSYQVSSISFLIISTFWILTRADTEIVSLYHLPPQEATAREHSTSSLQANLQNISSTDGWGSRTPLVKTLLSLKKAWDNWETSAPRRQTRRRCPFFRKSNWLKGAKLASPSIPPVQTVCSTCMNSELNWVGGNQFWVHVWWARMWASRDFLHCI